ncbi:MAG: hypothetical protein WCV88_05220 [Patescibacteria group bacterium]
MGAIANVLIQLLIYVAQFDNFTDLPVITEAWTVVRDLSNMFFIVILMVIAFGTLFHLEAYSWKKLLPKMILAAILVNFSRAICGVMVDASQIVMLTFVAAIKDAATVGFVEAFQLNQMLDFGNTTDPATNVGSTSPQRLAAIIMAGIMMSTVVSVVFLYVVVLIGRLVMIWFLTVLSPLAFVMNVLPQTEKYASQWWEMFPRYVVLGPMVMFFLWLSMFIAAKSVGDGGLGTVASPEEAQKVLASKKDLLKDVNAGAGALDTTLIAGFIISTMMMMAGMKLAQDNSSELGEYTGKAKALDSWVRGGALVVGGFAAGYAADNFFQRTGLDLNANRVWERWKHGMAKNKNDRVLEGESLAGKRYRDGYLLAGALGAGDQVAELGLNREQLRGGIVGNIPLLNNWKAAREYSGIGATLISGKQGLFKKALEDEQKTSENQTISETELDDEKKKVLKNGGNDLMTVEEYQKKLAELQKNYGGLLGIKEGDDLDLSEPGQRAALEKYRADLQAESIRKTATPDERFDASVRLQKLDAHLAAGGTVTARDVAAFAKNGKGSDVYGEIADSRIKAKADLDGWSNTRDQRTRDATLHTQADIDAIIDSNDEVKKRAAVVDEKKVLANNARKVRQKLGPQMGSGAEQKARAMIQEAKKNITTIDTTELCDMLEDALHKGRGYGPEALAIVEKLYETANINDAFTALGADLKEELKKLDKEDFAPGETVDTANGYSYAGTKALAQLLEKKTSMNDQIITATLHRGGQIASNNGHHMMGQMTETKNGEFGFRSRKMYEYIATIESNKMDPHKSTTGTTRLDWGDGEKFYESQRFILENYGRVKLSNSRKTDGTLVLNADKIRHLRYDSRRYHVIRNALIKQLGHAAVEGKGGGPLGALNENLRQNGLNVPHEYDRVDYKNTKADESNPANRLW